MGPDETTLVGALGTLDHHRVDWRRVRWTAYLIHQHLRYEYPGRIRDLHQRLIVVPPERHGGQRLVTHKLEVPPLEIPPPAVLLREERDAFGNLVLNLFVEQVERAIEFTAWIVVERDATLDPVRVPPEWCLDPRLREPSPLTTPDDALRAAADDLREQGARAGHDAAALAARINAWVHASMTYQHGATGVRTDAAAAFALRRGVCQDYAHVMLALCRRCDLPARYVSGHLLGEGGTHAWVEVLLPHPADDGAIVARAFDPTHGTEPGLNYITVAVGRDYGDVAPTSGTFRAPYGGQLSARKRAGVTAVEYFTP